MAEIYRNTTQFVYLDIYNGEADSEPEAVIAGDTPYILDVVEDTDFEPAQRWVVEIPLSETQDVRDFNIVWTFSVNGQDAAKVDRLTVVVPLVDLDDIRSELELPTETTDAQIVLMERRVRRIIEAHCNQKFEPRVETLTLTGVGTKQLTLPKRLISVTALRDNRAGALWFGFSIQNDGWALRRVSGYYYGEDATSSAPIYAPYTSHGLYAKWPAGFVWEVTGTWGWEYVPEEVREAALTLLEQRLCSQSAYRDNYLSSMKAADWRFDYFQESILGTGNAVADSLLESYRVVGAAVV